jgi:hypothetical protein
MKGGAEMLHTGISIMSYIADLQGMKVFEEYESV